MDFLLVFFFSMNPILPSFFFTLFYIASNCTGLSILTNRNLLLFYAFKCALTNMSYFKILSYEFISVIYGILFNIGMFYFSLPAHLLILYNRMQKQSNVYRKI